MKQFEPTTRNMIIAGLISLFMSVILWGVLIAIVVGILRLLGVHI